MIGMPRIIQVSVLGAEKESSSVFMSTKAIADDELVTEDDSFVVRPSIVCSHNTMMVQKMKMIGRMAKWTFNRLPFPAHFLQTKIQPVLVEDLAQIICNIARTGSNERIINISGPEEIGLDALIKLLNNGAIKIIPVSKELFDAMFPVLRIFASSLLSKEQMLLLSKNNTADNSICKSILGREMSSTWSFWKDELTTTSVKPATVCL